MEVANRLTSISEISRSSAVCVFNCEVRTLNTKYVIVTTLYCHPPTRQCRYT